MKRRDGHQANDSGAIGVGDKRALSDADLNPLHGLGIHLRDHQRDLLVHPKGRAVVHHDGPLFDRDGPELLADGTTGTEESDVDAVKALGGELLDGVVVALEGEAPPGGALGGEHFDGAEGEVPVRKHGEELLADGAGDADDGEGRSRFLEGHADRGKADGSRPGVGLGQVDLGREEGMVGEGGHFVRDCELEI